MTHDLRCLVCDGTVALHAVQSTYRYWRCASCATAQLLPQPTSAELDRYYREYHEAGGEYEGFDDRMQADFPMKARLAASLVPAGARLLDVGCGKGFYVKAAAGAGLRAEGIDLSPSGVEYAVKTLGVKATAGLIERNAPAEWRGAFDIITLWATIEHLPDGLAVLKAIRRCLKPGGILLMDTGLGQAPFEGWLGGHSQWYDAPQHLFVYSRSGLERLLAKAGFSIETVDLNFERSFLRRAVKWLRHAALCVSSWPLSRLLLGGAGFRQLQQQAKWPIGRLISIRARAQETPR